MTLADDVRTNTQEISGMKGQMITCQTNINRRLDSIHTDIKDLLRINGTRREQIGELRGKVVVICAIVLSSLAGVFSMAALIAWLGK